MTFAPTLPFSAVEVEPTDGRTRGSDPEPSRVGARRVNARSQRRMIAAWLSRHDYVTADQMWASVLTEKRPDRGTWSARLGGLVRDGLLEKGDRVPGPNQMVTSYVLTERGRAWRNDLLREA